jgi:poly-gamma-glutamate capsule biosynthesis protein CapA/YwtB (metallophosphatase superfamily)
MRKRPSKYGILWVLAIGLMGWQSWQEAIFVEIDTRLDRSIADTIIRLPSKTQELGLFQPLFFPLQALPALGRPRLKLALEQPTPMYSAAVYKQTYFQIIAPLQDMRPPLGVDVHGYPLLPSGERIYTADRLAFSTFRAKRLDIRLLKDDDTVMARIINNGKALGIVNVDHVKPQVRALTSPFAVRLWLGWRESSWPWFAKMGFDVKLFQTIVYLLNHPQWQKKPYISSLVAVGDIMLARRIGERIEEGDDDLYPFSRTQSVLSQADIATGNLECAISDHGTAMAKKDYTFRAAPSVVSRLKQAGFKILNVANNHSMDFGGGALTDTVNLLKKANIQVVGGGRNRKEASQLKVMTLKDGTKLGFLSYSLVVPENFIADGDHAGIHWADEKRFRGEIEHGKSLCDLLIVQFHWGEQYKSHSNAIQRHFGHEAIDYGADLVIGHHPHWIQEVEFYKGKFIAYSLGNFVFDMNHRPKVEEGLLLKCLFKDKALYQVELHPVAIKKGQPEVLPWGSEVPRNRETIMREIFQASGFSD